VERGKKPQPKPGKQASALGSVCLCCGRGEDLTVDHIIPPIRGGSSHPDNLQVLCRGCNAAKRQQIVDYRQLRLLV
jgi:5-methylcytosine-specific restriction endonuclease McrA